MTGDDREQFSGAQEEYLRYRTLSMMAVITLFLGIISIPAVFVPALLVIPVAGMVTGVWGIVRLRRRRDELSGIAVATVGLVLCTASVAVGSAFNAYVYATEVPEGYQRIHFDELQPDERYPRLPIPPTAIELDGRKVFIKGYVHPDFSRGKIKQFVLVPDMGTCCFGGQPKLTDMIEVTLRDPLRIDYSLARRGLAGILKVSPEKKPVSGLDGVYYQLDADYVK
jgi:hypothetical protein